MISEGGYGCIFSPYITCSGKVTKNYKYISKIQLKSFSAENEIKLGKKISKIPFFYRYFVPTTYHCDINIKEFKNADIDQCRIIKEHRKSPYILLKMPFIGYKHSVISYKDYIVQDINDREILLNLIDGYQHLLTALKLLFYHRICHFDLNGDNILFSQEKTIPLIVDFGLSISIGDFKEQWKEFFYVYAPEYYFWPLEVHYINYLQNVGTPTSGDLQKLCSTYIKHNIPLQQNFSPSFLKQYEKLCLKTVKKYLEDSLTKSDLLQYWYTWDNYTLSIMYLQIIFYLNVTKNGSAYVKNSFIVNFSKILLQNIHPNPMKRLSLKKTAEIFASFFYNPEVNKVENYDILLRNFSRNKKQLHKEVFEDIAQFKKLIKKWSKTPQT